MNLYLIHSHDYFVSYVAISGFIPRSGRSACLRQHCHTGSEWQLASYPKSTHFFFTLGLKRPRPGAGHLRISTLEVSDKLGPASWSGGQSF